MNEICEKMAKRIVPIKKQLKTFGEIKDTMLQACKIMDVFGLVQGFGHVSSRLPNTSNILVTPRKALGLATAQDLVIVDSEGKIAEGNATPFAEMHMHRGIYQRRPDVGAICRFHTEMTSVFGVLNRSVRVVHALGYLVGPEVRVLSSPNLGHTPEMIEEVGDLVSEGYGLIFRGNGAITLGVNIIDACVRALLLEESARIQYKASLLAEPTYLSTEEINRRNDDYWGLPDYDVYWRAWEYYQSKAGY
jgi:HCOMODA/2-hydroxy-3-carboxy-muconic semialdehyde decarboxylase